ncbi:hypothetical protein ABID82_002372 [Methylobacterium sp. PvP062]|uniref:Uncharacterized protein n=1 Tax=Methylobacterium radiotolerans TaxID=31998 RepID=A0ABV2NN88_9HYPH|nr:MULTISPECIES: hypothetical protein [unclassified Methylobacterium]MBP2495296.1 hypothetical protein [Methylobacterium sp. PvP105]MBP2504833.1 hypothetical protein [Methylobacterium sp. PvP109]MCX7335840.1 hypothetical protein [Hyphomicrobiales bacterium]
MAAPITDLASLQAAVLDYIARPDLVDAVPGFIALAESHFNAILRAREMEAEVSGGTAATPVAAMDLPTDFIEWLAVSWVGSGRTARPTFAEADSPEARFRHRPGGDPQYFTIRAGKVRMVPEKPGVVTLAYYAAIPPLTSDAPKNWLLAKAPDAYLYAVLAEAYLFQKDPAAVQAHTGLMLQVLAALGIKADTAKVAKRTGRPAELQASTQAVARPE